MGVASSFDSFTYKMNVMLRKKLVKYGEKQNIIKKKALIDKVVLSKDEAREIKEYYLKYYGKSISTSWHRLYQSYTGVYHVDYFPEILFSTELEPKTNPYREAEFLGDKNLLDVFFSDIEDLHIPETFISCTRGVLRNGCKEMISHEEARSIVKSLPSFVIKKTIDTSSGRDVHVYSGNEDPCVLLEQFGDNYVIQERINQHESISVFNPSSVNTFRVITYFCEGNLYICPLALRMGRSNADRDNIHYGGICIGIKSNGELRDTAFSEYGEYFTEHPDTHVRFEGKRIDTECIKKVALCMHSRIPYLGILSWDFTLDKFGTPTIIEMNSIGQAAWLCQMVNGEPLFGDNTPSMLSLIKKGK